MGKGVPTLTAKLAAECIGTFILSFTVVNCIQSKSELAPLSIASSLMIAVYCTGSVSGGHLNPAVTLGLYLAGKLGGPGVVMPAMEAGLYWVAQLVGAAIANAVATFIWTTDMGGGAPGMKNRAHGSLGSPAGFDTWRVFEGEAIYTMMLVFVVLNVATCNDMPGGNSYFGLAIGFVILAAASAAANVSGTCLNPAVTFGILITNFSKNISQIPVYWGAQVVGSILAVAFFYGCRAHLFKGGSATVTFGSRLLAEFLGTFFLVITVYQVVVQAAYAPVVAVVGIASSLMCMIYALWNVSGANFNPAVSLGLLITGNLSTKDFGSYILVQLLGGLAGVGMGALMQPPQSHVDLAMAQGSMAAVGGAEVFYTALLVFAVLSSAVRDAPNQYFGLIIGFSIVVGGVAIGSISGGAFNPAVSLSVFFAGLLDSENSVDSAALLYPVSELVGGALAAGAFMLIGRTQDDWTEYESSDSDSNA
eukprot:TRINITY_DN33687_c0_g1_i1.p1 TRINITY_DN33687_c0_g1~~TRINITY_DN33687_c0_g1_i1.p1  ORF type:complete len:490 (+),score=89.02 TRINITY_DN33687_c0_g1_i1:40-1470(+)